MAEAPLEVRLVATDREVWTGQASLVTLITAEGSVGIMARHSPLMAILQDGPILIRTLEGGDLMAAVHTGFAIVDSDQVIILAASAELAEEIDVDRAKALLAEAEASEPGPGRDAAERRAETRIKLAAQAHSHLHRH